MTTAFGLGYNAPDIAHSGYFIPGAMEEASENVTVPYLNTVIPSIWKNTETAFDLVKNANYTAGLDNIAIAKSEQKLSVEELRAKYPNANFTIPMYTTTAEHVAQRRQRQTDLEWIKSHSTVKMPGSNFLPELVSYFGHSFTDPLEVGFMVATSALTFGAGTLFPQLAKFTGSGLAYKIAGKAIPKGGRIMSELYASHLPLSARLTSRAITGFGEQALQNALMEPITASAMKQLGDDYTMANSMMNILVGGLMGSTFHIGGGLFSDAFSRSTLGKKLKASADYHNMLINGEDGVKAAAQNVMPITTLSAEDILNYKGKIKAIRTEDGRWRVQWKNEKGVMRNAEGITSRTVSGAIENMQYHYSKQMNNPVLFHQLNKFYGKTAAAKLGVVDLNPFRGTDKVKPIKNLTIVNKGGKKFKLEFDSSVDKMFYGIQKILSNPKNKGRSFDNLAYHKETIENYANWIYNNIGDTTETDIRQQARGTYNAVHKQITENLNTRSTDTEIKISPFIKESDLDVQPQFMSSEQWKKHLEQQRDVLLGEDKIAAADLLSELYEADKMLHSAKLNELKKARKDFQKLINNTEQQLEKLSEREQARIEVLKIAKERSQLTEEQLFSFLHMLDVVTGDFATFINENGIKYVMSKEYQAKLEKHLKQVTTKTKTSLRKKFTYEDGKPTEFFFLDEKEINAESYTTNNLWLNNEMIEALEEIKLSKYDLQDGLYTNKLSEVQEGTAKILDHIIENSHLKEDGIFYRGIPTEKSPLTAELVDIKPGMIIQSPGYLSVSADRAVANSFTEGAKPTILEMRLARGMTALDAEAAIAKGYKERLSTKDWKDIREIIDKGGEIAEEFDDRIGEIMQDLVEEEIVLPRDLALKVLDVKETADQRIVTVMPDTTLNNLYGTNLFREKVDLFFNKVQSNQALIDKMNSYQINTPEHFELAKEAYYNGVVISDEIINTYPELKIAQELTKSIPGTWLLQSGDRNAFKQRIIGEVTKDMPYNIFESLYGNNIVYALGNGKFTKYPDVAIRQTGRAVMYDLGMGMMHNIRTDISADLGLAMNEIVKWNPLLERYLTATPEEQTVIIQKVLNEASSLVNKAGETFLNYIDRITNYTTTGKVRKGIREIALNFNTGELIFTVQSQADTIKQIGEPSIFKNMRPESAMQVKPEAIYKSLITDKIQQVEIAQAEYAKAMTEYSRAKKKNEKTSTSNIEEKNQLDTSLKEASNKIKKAEKNVKKAKKLQEELINNINNNSEVYNQIIKGMVDTGTEGQYIVTLFQHADLSTLIHETAHIFRRTVLDADMLERAEKALGVKNGKWTEEAEEAFARSFEKYLATGDAPNEQLQGLFEAFKSWLTQIYIKLTQSPLEENLSPELRKVFDQLFSDERVRMAEQAGFKNEDISKSMYQKALKDHKNALENINNMIKDYEKMLAQDFNPNSSTFERLRQDKLARVQSELDMFELPTELSEGEIQEKMSEIDRVRQQEVNQYTQIADNQIEKLADIEKNPIEHLELETEMAKRSLDNYSSKVGLNEEQVSRLLEEESVSPDLAITILDQEAEANKILEGALREFADCARGEL